jgi:hypothetical protein
MRGQVYENQTEPNGAVIQLHSYSTQRNQSNKKDG